MDKRLGCRCRPVDIRSSGNFAPRRIFFRRASPAQCGCDRPGAAVPWRRRKHRDDLWREAATRNSHRKRASAPRVAREFTGSKWSA